MKKGLIIGLAVVAVIVIWAISTYNGLVKEQQKVEESWAQVENVYQRRADLIPNLVQTVNRTSEKIEKYRIIHNWIVENVNYYSSSEDMSNIFFENYDEKFLCQYNTNTTQNIYGAIVKKQAICDGISDAFKYICNLCNLECVTVDGYLGKFSDERYHAWNIVKIENDWYLVDCTWDLNNNGEKYFLCSDLYKGDRTPFKINYKIPGYDK